MKKATDAAVPHEDFIREMREHARRLDGLGDRANAAGDGKSLRRLRQWAQAAREEADIHERHGPGLDQVRRPGVKTAEDKSLWSGEPQIKGFLRPASASAPTLPQGAGA